MESPGFSEFRSLMDLCDDYLLEAEEGSKIEAFMDQNELILFFKKEGQYFGTDEDGRMVFAKMKKPDSEEVKGWDREATFTALCLDKAAKGQPAQHVFSKKDLKKIKVVDREAAASALKDMSPELPFGKESHMVRVIKLSRDSPNSDSGSNSFKADEE